MNLAEILTNRQTFEQVASGQIPIPDLTTDVDYDTAKRWRILSRVRFEYVRPTCTLRSQSVPSVAPCMTEEERDYGLKEYIKAGLYPDKNLLKIFSDAIANPVDGTLAYHLKAYYEKEFRENNETIIPNDKASLFPANYIIIHDLHHVLLGIDTSQAGEMAVIAFESGMIHRCDFPILLVEQLEIFLSDMTRLVSTEQLMKAWNIGKTAELLLENWQWQEDLHLPLEMVRQKYNVTAL